MTRQAWMAAAVLAGAAFAATPAGAQVGLAVRASTLGMGGEISVRPGRHLGLRLGGNYLTVTRNATIEGIEYDLSPRLQSGTAIADLHPFGGSFHLSAGVVWNSNEGDVEARLTGPITIGSQTYQPAEIGSLTGLVRYESRYAPYAGLGWSGRGRLSLVADFGVVFSGHPQVSLTSNSPLTGPERAALDVSVQQEIAEIQAQIDSRSYLKYYPVVSVGLRLGF